MARLSKSERSWSDAQLKDAVVASANWRDVMRALGLNANSAGAIRIVRRHVVRLGLDTSHFKGQRTWSDAQLRHAVIAGRVAILMHTYTKHVVGSAAGLVAQSAVA